MEVKQHLKKINLISFYDYAIAASRTLQNKISEDDDVGHFGLGVSTEYFELMDAIDNKDKVNISEELADACWYIANHVLKIYHQKHQIWEQLTEIFWKPQYSFVLTSEEIKYTRRYIRDYSDICKKQFAYNKKIDGYNHKLKDLILKLCKSYATIMLAEGINPIQSLTNNIEKLYVRYEDKFDSYFAMKRDLESELEKLKTGM